MIKYFVCDRVRALIDKEYVREFLAERPFIKFHDTYADANEELLHGFYDDSDYHVIKLNTANNEITIMK